MPSGEPRESLLQTAEQNLTGTKPASLRLNSIASIAGNLTYFGVVFLITPLAIRRLGAEGWGIWQLVGATAIYAQLLNLSLGTAIHYQVAVRTARRDFAGLSVVLTSVRIYLGLAGVVLLLLLALAGEPLVDFIVEDPQQRALAWSALAISIVLTSLDLQLRLFSSVLGGLQRMDLQGTFQIVGAFVLLAAVWFGFESGMGLRGFAALMTIGPGIAATLAAVALRRLLPSEGLRLSRPDLRLFREMVSYSLSTVLYTAGAVVLYQTMKFLAAWQCGGPAAAGHMGLAISLAQTLSVVFTPAAVVLLARVGQLKGEGRLDAVPALLERAFTVIGLTLVPSLVFLVVDTRAVFDAWVGGTQAGAVLDELTTTTRSLFIGHGFYIAALPFYYALLGVGQHRVFGVGMFVVALLNTALGALATALWPRIETLGLVYGILMLGLVLVVTAPAGLLRFPLPVARLLVRAIAIPLLLSAPGALVLLWRTRIGTPLADLAIDAVLFSLLCLPGLELARRRFGIPLRLAV